MSKRSALSRRDLLAMTGALAGSAAAIPVSSRSQDSEREKDLMTVESDGVGEKTGVLYKAADGPWGALNYFYFYLEAPMHLIEVFPLRNPRTRWAVPLEFEAEFRAILEGAPLSASQRSLLFNPDNLGVGDGLYAIFPPREVLETISHEARGEIYNYLSRFDVNVDIANPVRVRSGSVEDWAHGTEIRP